MDFNLDSAVVYDIEAFPNVFTLDMECLNNATRAVWEISHFRDDRRELMEWFNYLNYCQIPMIGFNNLHYDYPMIHFIFNNPNATVEQIYEKNNSIIDSDDRWGHTLWPKDRFAPQVDLYTIHHFDNMAKSTNLKALQINMRSPNVVEMSIPFGTVLTEADVDTELLPYNAHDTGETKQFAHLSKNALDFRVGMVDQFGVDVMNWNDTKIGTKIMEQKIGQEICYDSSSGKKLKRQTPRSKIALADVIFPYIQFENPEFQRILDYMNAQVLLADEVKEIGKPAKVKTKGVFTKLSATVGDMSFHFGTGGIHGSISAQKIEAQGDWIIRDIDVKSLYPSISNVNRLSPEHLGERFVEVYAQLPEERAMWQEKKGKKCTEANSIKLAGNGVYGNSNNAYSVFYDPLFTMTITINGQLMLCMLAEKLATVPTLKLIQINTDGITYYINKAYEPQAAALCKEWELRTALVLEDADYSRMWIRDVNNYIAEDTDGNLKLKGAYWSPNPLDYHGSIASAQPPAWHKDLGNCVSVRAAVAYMIHGVDPETYIRLTTDPYDFMCRIKTPRSNKLLWGGEEQQRNTRYFISNNGREMIKTAPPAGVEGTFKRAVKVTQHEYERVMSETGGQWDERVCTKNKSVYETRRTKIQAGHKVTICNDIQDFDFNDINYEWYINEAKKLIIV